MDEPKFPTATIRLKDLAENAHAVMLRASIEMKFAGATQADREDYLMEATAGDYDNLITVTKQWVTVLDKNTPYLRIDTDGAITELPDADLSTMRKAIADGWIEHVALRNGLSLWVDDNGKAKDLPPNPIATHLYGFAVIYGPVVLTGPADREGDSTPIPQDGLTQVYALQTMLHGWAVN